MADVSVAGRFKESSHINLSLQIAGVQYVLDTVIHALHANPDRKFAYAEMVSLWPENCPAATGIHRRGQDDFGLKHAGLDFSKWQYKEAAVCYSASQADIWSFSGNQSFPGVSARII